MQLVLLDRGVSATENHDLDSVALQHALDQLEAEPAQPVAVTDDHLGDSSLTSFVHDLQESRSLPVDPGSDVGHASVVVGVLALEIVDLAREVLFLLLRADARVQDRFRFVGVCESDKGAHVGHAVLAVSAEGGDERDFAFVRPGLEGA